MNAESVEVWWHEDTATRFCLGGACKKSGLILKDLGDTLAAAAGVPREFFRSPPFNDTHTHAEVLEALDAAIEEAY